MHCTRLAPELSATSRMVRIWIMAAYSSTNFLTRRVTTPALVARDRAVLLDLDLVADLVLVRLVVRLVAVARCGRTCRRAGRGVCVTTSTDDGLVHLVADDLADRSCGGSRARFVDGAADSASAVGSWRALRGCFARLGGLLRGCGGLRLGAFGFGAGLGRRCSLRARVFARWRGASSRAPGRGASCGSRSCRRGGS